MVYYIVVLTFCFSSIWAQLPGGDPSGEIGPEIAAKTAEEFKTLNEQTADKPCSGVMDCYPGAYTKEGFKDFDKNCRENPNDINNLKIKKVCDNDDEGQKTFGAPSGKRRKRQTTPDPANEIYLWKCDFAAQSCCRTCRRTIPMIETLPGKDGKKIFPIFCPVEGGFQLKDDVACVQQGCRQPCQKAFTLYSFLVTDVPPNGFNGHCDMDFIPVWFASVKLILGVCIEPVK